MCPQISVYCYLYFHYNVSSQLVVCMSRSYPPVFKFFYPSVLTVIYLYYWSNTHIAYMYLSIILSLFVYHESIIYPVLKILYAFTHLSFSQSLSCMISIIYASVCQSVHPISPYLTLLNHRPPGNHGLYLSNCPRFFLFSVFLFLFLVLLHFCENENGEIINTSKLQCREYSIYSIMFLNKT